MTIENQPQELNPQSVGKVHVFSSRWFWIFGVIIGVLIATNIITYLWFNSPARVGLVSVNGEIIKKDEFIKAMMGQGGRSVLDWLIESKLIYQKAKEEGISISDKEIEDRISQIRDSFGSQEKFLSFLSMYGLTEESLKEQLVPRLLTEKILVKNKTITDKELLDYFNKNKSVFDEKEQLKLRHILAKTLEEAQQVEEELKKGGDFSKLAKERSIDTASSSQGGDLGWIGRGVLDPALEKVVFALKVGERSPIVKTSFGYEIVEVLDKKVPRSVTFEEVKDKVRERYIEDIVQKEYSNWIQELKSSANIVYYVNLEK
ncbi:MAG: peptidylprolyl isomerase [bacterium]